MVETKNAASVVADLEKKAQSFETGVKNGDIVVVPEVTRTKEPRAKLTDLVIALIKNAAYLPEEGKTTLLAEIDKIVNKVTAAKPSIKLEIRELLVAAGEKGISRDELYTVLAAKHPEVSPMNLALSIYPVMQPVNYVHGGKLGWEVKVVTGGNYVWVK